MLEQLFEKLSDEISITHDFYTEDLTIITKTAIGSKIIHTHEFDLSEVYTAFKERLLEEEFNEDR